VSRPFIDLLLRDKAGARHRTVGHPEFDPSSEDLAWLGVHFIWGFSPAFDVALPHGIEHIFGQSLIRDNGDLPSSASHGAALSSSALANVFSATKPWTVSPSLTSQPSSQKEEIEIETFIVRIESAQYREE
jgi:hypothetical protein